MDGDAGTEMISLGPAPAEEPCAAVGELDYEERAGRECAAYIDAIRRVCGPEPDGARLHVAWRDHDFGRYLEVVCTFDGHNRTAAEYAARCDECAPSTWAAAGVTPPGSFPARAETESARDAARCSVPGSLPDPLRDLPVPPELAEAFGYTGPARFVGFYWIPCGDELIATDGRSTETGNGWTFLAYKRHRAVAQLLEPFDLGSSEEDAAHMLLVDRERNEACIVSVAEGRARLDAQHPPAPELTPEQRAVFEQELEYLLAERRERPIDAEAVARAMTEQRERVARMIAWLDRGPAHNHGSGPRP